MCVAFQFRSEWRETSAIKNNGFGVFGPIKFGLKAIGFRAGWSFQFARRRMMEFSVVTFDLGDLHGVILNWSWTIVVLLEANMCGTRNEPLEQKAIRDCCY